MRRFGNILACCLLGAMSGCVEHTKPVVPPPTMTPAQRHYEDLWQACRQVLQDYYFVLDRQDRRAGVITTLPMVGQQPSEFWRRDAVTWFDVEERILQTVYLTAAVQITALPNDANAFQAEIRVTLARSDQQLPLISTTTEAYDLFAGGGRTRWVTRGQEQDIETEHVVRQESMNVAPKAGAAADASGSAASKPTSQPATAPAGKVNLGRDLALERRLAEEIAKRSKRTQ